MKIAALRHPLAPFAIATLAPVPFLLLGGFLGALWLIPALLWLTVLTLAGDRLAAGGALPAWLRRTATKAPAPDASAEEPVATEPDSVVDTGKTVPSPEIAGDVEPTAAVPPQAASRRDAIDDSIAALLRDEPQPESHSATIRHAAFAPLADGAEDPRATIEPTATTGRTATRPAAPSAVTLAAGRLRASFAGLASRMTRLLASRLPARAATVARRLSDADRLSVLLAPAHLLLLVAALYGLSGRAGYGVPGWIVAFFAFGIWFGQVSNSNAHELIHRRDRRLRRLGAAIYATLLFGHHASAHRLVHHRFVATLDDPNTAQLGESFYRFVLRAWPGAFIAGYEMEAAIRQRRTARRRLPPVHPYVWYLGGSLLTAILVVILFGLAGLLAWVLLAGYAQIQLLLSDYVQHYGLRRRALALGRVEPLGPRHSWDAPRPFSAALMLNAPLHADHHLHPERRWSELAAPGLSGGPQGQAPVLPYSLPVMGALALWPAGWRRLMDKRVKLATRAA